jgi:hypothetical protein
MTTYLHTLLTALLLPLLSSALPTPQSSNQEGDDVPSGGIGFDPNSQDAPNTGNAGPDTGAVNLSKGATIAISVVASVVVVSVRKYHTNFPATYQDPLHINPFHTPTPSLAHQKAPR